MRVNPNSEAMVVSAGPGRTAAPQPRLGQDEMTLTTAQSLNRSLEQTPDVRPDKVAEAKALIQDGSYPPAVIIRKISALLAIKLDPQNNAD
jgi:anti-sigma28 factor (negative regulator of flagellin synthesis)